MRPADDLCSAIGSFEVTRDPVRSFGAVHGNTCYRQAAQQVVCQAAAVIAVYLDLSKVDYISSAGLRVMLIMCKSLKDQSAFRVINYNDEVKEILNVTGFSDILEIS